MADTETSTADQEQGYSSNYARIACLLMREGTEQMKAVTLRHLPPRQTLKQALICKKDMFVKLRKKGILSKPQHDILYPFCEDFNQIDMTMWLILARNVTKKSFRLAVQWNGSPASHETGWQHDFIRLREIRNYLFHVSSPELTDEKFVEIKRDLVAALKRLGSDDVTIETLLSRDLDPQQTSVCITQLKQQYMEERWMEHTRKKQHTRFLILILSVLSLLVAVAIGIVTYWFLGQKTPCYKSIIRLRADSGVVNFIPRHGWGAREPSHKLTPLTTPVSMVVIHHTAFVQAQCDVTSDCCEVVNWIQKAQMDGTMQQGTVWWDIAYNYLIGDDGVVYEGRGAPYEAGSDWHLNNKIITVALMGNYACAVPSRAALMALYVFLEYLTNHGPAFSSKNTTGNVLTEDYDLYGQCQVYVNSSEHRYTFPDSPGAGTMGEISLWTHWSAVNVTRCNMKKDCLASYQCCKAPCNSSWYQTL